MSTGNLSIHFFNPIQSSTDFSKGQVDVTMKNISQVHEKIKPFHCDVCDKKFSRKEHLKLHIERVHERKKAFMCDIC